MTIKTPVVESGFKLRLGCFTQNFFLPQLFFTYFALVNQLALRKSITKSGGCLKCKYK